MLQSGQFQRRCAIQAAVASLARRCTRLVEASRLLRLRLEAARRYAMARGPSASASAMRGARPVPAPALEWHQQMRRLDTLMLAPDRSLGARIVWRLTRAWARRDAGPLGPAAA
jgi:hypothetical protein